MQADINPRNARAKQAQPVEVAQQERLFGGFSLAPQQEQPGQRQDGDWVEVEGGVAENGEGPEDQGGKPLSEWSCQ